MKKFTTMHELIAYLSAANLSVEIMKDMLFSMYTVEQCRTASDHCETVAYVLIDNAPPADKEQEERFAASGMLECEQVKIFSSLRLNLSFRFLVVARIKA